MQNYTIITNPNRQDITPLMTAISKGETEKAMQLIEQGADVNAKTPKKWTPLIIAVKNNQPEVAGLLIEKGADVNAVAEGKWTPLLFAARFNHPEIATLLIEKGADYQSTVLSGQTYLHYAACGGNTELVSWFLDRGMDTESTDNAGRTPINFAVACKSDNRDAITQLMDAGAKANIGEVHDGSNGNTFEFFGKYYAEQGNAEKAVHYFEDALEHYEKDIDKYESLKNRYSRAANPPSWVKVLSSALQSYALSTMDGGLYGSVIGTEMVNKQNKPEYEKIANDSARQIALLQVHYNRCNRRLNCVKNTDSSVQLENCFK